MTNYSMQRSLREIENDFRKSLYIPVGKPPQQIFFCPVGLVGAGKTTVTKPISDALGLVRISSDELRKRLKENGHTYESVKEIGKRVATDFINEGYSIAFDMDCGNTEVKSLIDAIIKEKGITALWVHVDSPEEYIFEKFRDHSPSWLADNPRSMIDNYKTQKKKREEEETAFDFFFTFDTSKSDIDRQIETFLCLVREKIEV